MAKVSHDPKAMPASSPPASLQGQVPDGDSGRAVYSCLLAVQACALLGTGLLPVLGLAQGLAGLPQVPASWALYHGGWLPLGSRAGLRADGTAAHATCIHFAHSKEES